MCKTFEEVFSELPVDRQQRINNRVEAYLEEEAAQREARNVRRRARYAAKSKITKRQSTSYSTKTLDVPNP